MIQLLLSLIGVKEYWIRIMWDDGRSELIKINAWSSVRAIEKVSKEKDVVNKATLKIIKPVRSKLAMARYEDRGEYAQFAKKISDKEICSHAEQSNGQENNR